MDNKGMVSGKDKIFFLGRTSRPAPGLTQLSYPVGSEHFPQNKAEGEPDHTFQPSAEMNPFTVKYLCDMVTTSG
jgi:hypothetical protein